MSASKRPATPFCVAAQPSNIHAIDQGLDFHVAKLADVIVTPAFLGPTEENVARGLHEPLAGHDALAAVGVVALSGIRLQHTLARFLDLEKERVVAGSHHQQDGTI